MIQISSQTLITLTEHPPPVYLAVSGDSYDFLGWSLSNDDNPQDEALKDVEEGRTVWACYGKKISCVQYWYNADGSHLATTYFPMNEIAIYPYDSPTLSGTTWPFTGWNPSDLTVNSQIMTFYAQYQMPTGWRSDMSWNEIIQKHDNGTYTQIPLGTKAVASYGSYGLACMQLVGVNVDSKSDGGTAKTTWIPTSILNEKTQWRITEDTIGGWASSKIRTHCQSIFEQLQSDIKARVDTVTKYSYSTNPKNANLSSTDQLWIPSYREMNLGTDLETIGPAYSSVYTDNNARIKRNASGTASVAWLRSASSSVVAFIIASDGSGTNSRANNSNGVCPGFCLT